MLAVLCGVPLLTFAMSVDDDIFGRRSRKDYLPKIIPNIIAYVPPNDAEVWFGWWRINTGQYIFRDIAAWKFSIKFRAPANRLSTAIEIQLGPQTCLSFRWVRVNIPGTDVSRGEDIHAHHTVLHFNFGARTLLVFPQKKKLDVSTANQSFTPLKGCDIPILETTFELHRADAFNVYATSPMYCGGDRYRVSNGDTPDWEHVRPNMNQITHPDVFLTPPRGVLEIEYFEEASLRMGNCLPVFLTASARDSVKFAAAPTTYYTVCYVEYTKSFRCRWLLVNVHCVDISKGVEVVRYSSYTDSEGTYVPCVFLLFSQGKDKIIASEIKKMPSLTPKAISDKFKLGDPVAANFYRAYWTCGGPPGKYPPIPSTGLPAHAPEREWSSTRKGRSRRGRPMQ